MLAAAPLTGVTLRRAGEATVWLGETATVPLTVGNGSRRRRCGCGCATAGCRPRAPDNAEHRLSLLPGEEQELDHHADADPAR